MDNEERKKEVKSNISKRILRSRNRKADLSSPNSNTPITSFFEISEKNQQSTIIIDENPLENIEKNISANNINKSSKSEEVKAIGTPQSLCTNINNNLKTNSTEPLLIASSVNLHDIQIASFDKNINNDKKFVTSAKTILLSPVEVETPKQKKQLTILPKKVNSTPTIIVNECQNLDYVHENNVEEKIETSSFILEKPSISPKDDVRIIQTNRRARTRGGRRRVGRNRRPLVLASLVPKIKSVDHNGSINIDLDEEKFILGETQNDNQRILMTTIKNSEKVANEFKENIQIDEPNGAELTELNCQKNFRDNKLIENVSGTIEINSKNFQNKSENNNSDISFIRQASQIETKNDNDEIKETPPNQINEKFRKKLSMSTPRKASHIKILDFKTPDRLTKFGRKSATSPRKISHVTKNLTTKLNKLKGPLFQKTPVKKNHSETWDSSLRKLIENVPSGQGIGRKRRKRIAPGRKAVKRTRNALKRLAEVDDEEESELRNVVEAPFLVKSDEFKRINENSIMSPDRLLADIQKEVAEVLKDDVNSNDSNHLNQSSSIIELTGEKAVPLTNAIAENVKKQEEQRANSFVAPSIFCNKSLPVLDKTPLKLDFTDVCNSQKITFMTPLTKIVTEETSFLKQTKLLTPTLPPTPKISVEIRPKKNSIFSPESVSKTSKLNDIPSCSNENAAPSISKIDSTSSLEVSNENEDEDPLKIDNSPKNILPKVISKNKKTVKPPIRKGLPKIILPKNKNANNKVSDVSRENLIELCIKEKQKMFGSATKQIKKNENPPEPANIRMNESNYNIKTRLDQLIKERLYDNLNDSLSSTDSDSSSTDDSPEQNSSPAIKIHNRVSKILNNNSGNGQSKNSVNELNKLDNNRTIGNKRTKLEKRLNNQENLETNLNKKKSTTYSSNDSSNSSSDEDLIITRKKRPTKITTYFPIKDKVNNDELSEKRAKDVKQEIKSKVNVKKRNKESISEVIEELISNVCKAKDDNSTKNVLKAKDKKGKKSEIKKNESKNSHVIKKNVDTLEESSDDAETKNCKTTKDDIHEKYEISNRKMSDDDDEDVIKKRKNTFVNVSLGTSSDNDSLSDCEKNTDAAQLLTNKCSHNLEFSKINKIDDKKDKILKKKEHSKLEKKTKNVVEKNVISTVLDKKNQNTETSHSLKNDDTPNSVTVNDKSYLITAEDDMEELFDTVEFQISDTFNLYEFKPCKVSRNQNLNSCVQQKNSSSIKSKSIKIPENQKIIDSHLHPSFRKGNFAQSTPIRKDFEQNVSRHGREDRREYDRHERRKEYHSRSSRSKIYDTRKYKFFPKYRYHKYNYSHNHYSRFPSNYKKQKSKEYFRNNDYHRRNFDDVPESPERYRKHCNSSSGESDVDDFLHDSPRQSYDGTSQYSNSHTNMSHRKYHQYENNPSSSYTSRKKYKSPDSNRRDISKKDRYKERRHEMYQMMDVNCSTSKKNDDADTNRNKNDIDDEIENHISSPQISSIKYPEDGNFEVPHTANSSKETEDSDKRNDESQINLSSSNIINVESSSPEPIKKTRKKKINMDHLKIGPENVRVTRSYSNKGDGNDKKSVVQKVKKIERRGRKRKIVHEEKEDGEISDNTTKIFIEEKEEGEISDNTTSTCRADSEQPCPQTNKILHENPSCFRSVTCNEKTNKLLKNVNVDDFLSILHGKKNDN